MKTQTAFFTPDMPASRRRNETAMRIARFRKAAARLTVLALIGCGAQVSGPGTVTTSGATSGETMSRASTWSTSDASRSGGSTGSRSSNQTVCEGNIPSCPAGYGLSSSTRNGCPQYSCVPGSGTSSSQVSGNGSSSQSTSASTTGCPVLLAVCPPCAPADKQSCPPLGCGQSTLQCSYDCAHGQGYNKAAECNGQLWSVQAYLTSCNASSGSSASASCPDAGS